MISADRKRGVPWRLANLPSMRDQNREHPLLGFSLVELMVVVAIISVLIALLLPAVMSARETANQLSCRNNVRQLALALQQHETAHQQFPVGAESSTGGGIGVSWFVSITPYLDGPQQLEQLDRTRSFVGTALLNSHTGKIVDGVKFDVFDCPSSPLNDFHMIKRYQVMKASYVGISGATSDPTFVESRTNYCCFPGLDGAMSAGGVLVPNQAIRVQHITDGASKTLCIGETSDFALNNKGEKRHQLDGGVFHGWTAGTLERLTPPNASRPDGIRSWNITTLRHAINETRFGLPGVSTFKGPNNPLLSAHRGGVVAAKCDGSVTFLSNDTSIHTLKQLATRDDGQSHADQTAPTQ